MIHPQIYEAKSKYVHRVSLTRKIQPTSIEKVVIKLYCLSWIITEFAE